MHWWMLIKCALINVSVYLISASLAPSQAWNMPRSEIRIKFDHHFFSPAVSHLGFIYIVEKTGSEGMDMVVVLGVAHWQTRFPQWYFSKWTKQVTTYCCFGVLQEPSRTIFWQLWNSHLQDILDYIHVSAIELISNVVTVYWKSVGYHDYL